MFHSVTDAKYIKDYKVWIAFDDGKEEEINLAEKTKRFGGVFIPLKNVEYFKDFKIRGGTLSWENEADIAPESLYKLLNQQKINN